MNQDKSRFSLGNYPGTRMRRNRRRDLVAAAGMRECDIRERFDLAGVRPGW